MWAQQRGRERWESLLRWVVATGSGLAMCVVSLGCGKDSSAVAGETRREAEPKGPAPARVSDSRRAKAEAAVAKLKSPQRDVRLMAVAALVDPDQIGYVPDRALEPLLKMAAEEDTGIRSWTMSALGMLGRKHLDRTGPVLLAALKDDRDVAISAARALGWLRVEESVPALAALTEDKDPTLRNYAAEALSFIGTEQAKTAFMKYARQDIPGLVKESAEADEESNASWFLWRMLLGMQRLRLMHTPEAKKVQAAWQKVVQQP